ncbi:hypothetical protein, partial [Novosphingobium panipatense]
MQTFRQAPRSELKAFDARL